MTKPYSAQVPSASRAGQISAALAAMKRFSEGPAVGNSTPRTQPADLESVAETPPGPDWLRFVPETVRGLVQSHLPAGLPDFAIPAGGITLPSGFGLPLRGPSHGAAEAVVPEGAQFLSRTFSNPAGTRPYKLYVPSGYTGQPVPLIVMLHGCTQSPDDFAAGTGMNAAAEERTCLVVYPGQTSGAHAQKCWNWYSGDDQQRGSGEPSLIAGITRQVMQDYAVDPRRVYVAGLSAGGAAAAIMGETYPDLYAAIGVHSGLACGAARDLPSAMAAMRGGSGAVAYHNQHGSALRRLVPSIVFHGDRDTTVSPRNGDDVVEQSVQGAAVRSQVQAGQVPDGRAYSRTIRSDATGQPVSEQWLVHGAGHAWSGGRAAGSYTDPQGPDATQEMLRFFQEHPHPGPAA
jgi:poly(hydroxyalkanoate) depolymerase family esterase